MSCGWNHTVSSPFRLTSSTWYSVFKVPPCYFHGLIAVTRDGTQAPRVRSVKSQPLDHQESLNKYFLRAHYVPVMFLPYVTHQWIKYTNIPFPIRACIEGESESEFAQSCPTPCDPIDCSLLGSSVHGIFQAKVLEWVVIAFSRGSSQPRDRTQVSRIVRRWFTLWATRKSPYLINKAAR